MGIGYFIILLLCLTGRSVIQRAWSPRKGVNSKVRSSIHIDWLFSTNWTEELTICFGGYCSGYPPQIFGMKVPLIRPSHF